MMQPEAPAVQFCARTRCSAAASEPIAQLIPLGQGWQSSRTEESLYHAAGQRQSSGVQLPVARVVSEELHNSHCTLPLPVAYEPAAQGVHRDAACEEYVPSPHGLHSGCCTASLYCPAAQAEHAEDPAVPATKPTAHGVHELDAFLEL